MLPRRVDDQLVFARVVPTRLLDVDVLPGIERECRRHHMPVIGRGDGQHVDALVLEHSPKVGDGFGRSLLPLGRGRLRFREDVRVHIAEVGDHGIGIGREPLHVHHSASVQSHHGNAQFFCWRPVEGEERTDTSRDS